MFWRKHWYKITMIAVSVVLLGAVAYVYLGGDDEPPFPVQGPAAPFTLPAHDGTQVTIEKTLGDVKLVYFFYANCPDVCPPTTHMLSRVQDRLQESGVFGKDFFIFQITVDPERDTLENLAKYAANMYADASGWKFLRGTEEETKKIADGYGIIFMKDEKTGLVAHSNTVILVDGDNQIRKRYNGDDLDDELIAKDVLRLLRSKS